MKKMILVVTAIFLAVVLAACGGAPADTAAPTPEATEAATPEPTEAATPEPTPEATATPEPTEAATPEPTPEATAEQEDGGVFSYALDDVSERFWTTFLTLEELLGEPTSLFETMSMMDLEQDEDNPNEYKTPLIVLGSDIFFLTDDNGDVLAILQLDKEEYTDKYKGKTQAYSITSALAPFEDDEQVEDRVAKIDAMDPAENDFEVFGGIAGDYAVILNSGNLKGDYTMYMAIRLNLDEDTSDAVIEWSGDVMEREGAG